jgi:serine/threonine protein kinase
LPFDGATPLDIWQAHAENPPAPPIDIAPGSVSPALNSIILRLLAKQPENRYQTATEFCVALENLTEDGHPRSTPAPIRIGHFSESSGGRAEETSSVFPPEISTEEERRREIEELRASLGLHIEEPASGDDASEQMSALVIDLGPTRAGTGEPKSLHRGETHSLPLRTGGGKVRVARNIEERKHVPPLAAPSARPVAARPVDNSSRVIEATVLTRRPKFGWVRIAIVAILLVAATILAIQFIP